MPISAGQLIASIAIWRGIYLRGGKSARSAPRCERRPAYTMQAKLRAQGRVARIRRFHEHRPY